MREVELPVTVKDCRDPQSSQACSGRSLRPDHLWASSPLCHLLLAEGEGDLGMPVSFQLKILKGPLFTYLCECDVETGRRILIINLTQSRICKESLNEELSTLDWPLGICGWIVN